MFRRPSLAAVVTAARAGALDHAEALFRDGGYATRDDDAAALAVKGRLLKDRALRLPVDARRDALLAAAQAYGAADALKAQPYTRINTATLSLLAGEPERAATIAGGILAWLDSGEPIRETPWFLAAIRAEALLLRGEDADARAVMQAAAALGADWSDRASSLRQLRLVLAAQGKDDGWLDAFRAPCSLHFAGHMALGEGDVAMRKAIDAELARLNAGFGFGALAAGADLVIAEQLLAAGAELHVVLPTSAGQFVEQSVRPYGGDWLARFETCMAEAAEVTETAHVTGAYEPLATQLASEVAMGAACRNAAHVDGEAAQLVVVDDGPGPFGEGIGTAAIAKRWQAQGLEQVVLRAPRAAPVVPSGRKAGTEGRQDRRLVALLRIGFAGIDALDEAEFAEAVDNVLTPFRRATLELAEPPLLTLPAGNSRIAAFATPEAAWRHARALFSLPAPRLPLVLAGHYGLAHWLADPAALVGRSVAQLDALAGAAMPGVLTVSEAFASALFLGARDGVFAEVIGEVEGMRLYTVTGLRAAGA